MFIVLEWSSENIMLHEILDNRLPPPTDERIERDIIIASSFAFACLRSKPKSRPTMEHVSRELVACKRLSFKSFGAISIADLTSLEFCSTDEDSS